MALAPIAWGCLALSSAAAVQESVESLVRAGQLRSAVALAEAERESEGGPARLVDTRYRAGDLGGALLTARQGLEVTPEDPLLLLHAVDLGLQLRQFEEVQTWLPRLHGSAQGLASVEARDFYLGRHATFSSELTELQALDRHRSLVVARARWVALGLLGVSLVLLVARLIASPRAACARETARTGL